MNKIVIEGMRCGGCQKRVQKALEALPGAVGVVVDREKGIASWDAMGVSVDEVIETVKALGFASKQHTCGCGGGCGCQH